MQKLKKFQPELFINSKYLDHYKAKTPVIGDFFEDCSANLLNLERLSVNCTQDCCPDLVQEDKKVYWESKAGKLSKSLSIRREQYMYYKDFVELNFPSIDDLKPIFKVDLNYIIWFYNDIDNFNQIRETEILRKTLAESISNCFIVGLDFIDYLFKQVPIDTKHPRFTCEKLKDFFHKYYKYGLKPSKVQTIGCGFKTKRFNLLKGIN